MLLESSVSKTDGDKTSVPYYESSTLRTGSPESQDCPHHVKFLHRQRQHQHSNIFIHKSSVIIIANDVIENSLAL